MKRIAAGLLTAGLLSTGLVLIAPAAQAAPALVTTSTVSKAKPKPKPNAVPKLGGVCAKRQKNKIAVSSPVNLKCTKILGSYRWIPAVSMPTDLSTGLPTGIPSDLPSWLSTL